jgi:hypothetical protein
VGFARQYPFAFSLLHCLSGLSLMVLPALHGESIGDRLDPGFLWLKGDRPQAGFNEAGERGSPARQAAARRIDLIEQFVLSASRGFGSATRRTTARRLRARATRKRQQDGGEKRGMTGQRTATTSALRAPPPRLARSRNGRDVRSLGQP